MWVGQKYRIRSVCVYICVLTKRKQARRGHWVQQLSKQFMRISCVQRFAAHLHAKLPVLAAHTINTHTHTHQHTAHMFLLCRNLLSACFSNLMLPCTFTAQLLILLVLFVRLFCFAISAACFVVLFDFASSCNFRNFPNFPPVYTSISTDFT